MMFTRRRVLVVLTALAITILVPLSASAQARASGAAASVAGATSIAQVAEAAKTLEAIQLSFREIAKKVLPVVVKIDVVEVVKQPAVGGQSPFRFFFGVPRGDDNGDNGTGPGEMRVNGLGSGIIVRRTGNTVYVLTNNHVVESATEVSVKLNDQRTFSAKVVGKDARRDIALVSFETKDPVVIAELGDSSDLQVGDLVMAVGNPFGFESTLTMGIVSALGRSAPQGQQTYTDYIQTDASINQGNSGGALVNMRGQVVGINTWIAAPTGGSVGVGFAIPINNAKKAIDDFITKGKVEYGWLGVQIGDIQDSATYPGFAKDLKVEGLKGAFVLNIYKGSPADKAGLLPGDYVLRADGQDIRNADHLTQVVGAMVAGRTYAVRARALRRAAEALGEDRRAGRQGRGGAVQEPVARHDRGEDHRRHPQGSRHRQGRRGRGDRLHPRRGHAGRHRGVPPRRRHHRDQRQGRADDDGFLPRHQRPLEEGRDVPHQP